MVPTSLLELVLLPVYDDCCYLLVHEDQDGGEEGENWGKEHVNPPGDIKKV